MIGRKKVFRGERVLAWLLSLVICLSALPADAFAEETSARFKVGVRNLTADAAASARSSDIQFDVNGDAWWSQYGVAELNRVIADAGEGSVITVYLKADAVFNGTVYVPAGKTVKVYDWGGYRTLYRGLSGSGDMLSYPVFVVRDGGELLLGGDRLTVNGTDPGSGERMSSDSLAVVESGGSLTLADKLKVTGCHSYNSGGAVYAHAGSELAIDGSVSFSDCSAGKGGDNVYVEAGCAFTNFAGVKGVQDDNTARAELYDAVYLTVLKDAYDGLPGEPAAVTRSFTWVNGGYVPDGTDTKFDSPAYRVVADGIFSSSDYVGSTETGDETRGVVDPTGNKIKQFVDVDWDEFLSRLAGSGSTQIRSDGTTLGTGNMDGYEIVPYVVKHQTNKGTPGWHIDCAVLPKNRIQVDYLLNLPDGIKTDFAFAVPTGHVSITDSLTMDVDSLKYNGAAVPEDCVIDGTYEGGPARLKFTGWKDSETGEMYDPGVNKTFDASRQLAAQWEIDYLTEFELPRTGGTGTAPYTAAGMTAMAAGLLLAGRRRRQR